jgi:hypothetical protein
MGMRDTIKFEMDDWVEIVEALGSKIRQIESGQLGPEDHPGQDKEWIAHLLRVIRKIEGPKCTGTDFAIFKKSVITKKGGVCS